MEKFMVVFQPDNGQRVLGSHPVLRYLPEKIARIGLPYVSAQVTGIILDQDNNEELGCLIDVPGFLFPWDQLEEEDRLKTVKGIAQILKRLNISVLCFPLLTQYFNQEECQMLRAGRFVVLDGFHHRLAGLLLVAKQLLHIMADEIPRFEIGIWGADTQVGRVWVEALAGEVNQMCIGGQNYRELAELADHILRTTGLSCQVTNQPDICLDNKNITVLAESTETSFSSSNLSFHFHSIQGQNFNNSFQAKTQMGIPMKHCYYIEMGWMTSPQDLAITQELHSWEELGVLEGLFYSISRVYREDILTRRITLDQMKRLHALYELYPLKLQGFVQRGRRIHFDRFRKEYFSNSDNKALDKSRYYYYNYRD